MEILPAGDQSAVPARQNERVRKIEGFDVGLTTFFSTVRDGKKIYLHNFLKPLDEDWDTYLRMQPSEMTRVGKKVSFDGDDTGAIIWFWESFIQSVTDPAGNPVLPEDPNWKERVPFLHKQRAVRQLTSIRPDDEEMLNQFGSPERRVQLMVPQNGYLFAVVHIFNEPEDDDAIIYRRLRLGAERSFTESRGGALQKVSVIDLPGYRALYKKLAKGCGEYVENGESLTGADWINKIPSPHKKAALDSLFYEDEDLLGN